MKRFLTLLPLALSALLLMGFLLLGFLPEPFRVQAWLFLQLFFLLWAVAGIVGVLGYVIIRRRWRSVKAWGTLVAAVALGVFGLLAPGMLRYPAQLDDGLDSLAVRPPLDGPVVVAWGGDTLSENYHVSLPDQRWAYDLVIAPYFIVSDVLEDFGCYGSPVIAPVSGKVVASVDGIPDQPIGILAGFLVDPMGNHVAIEPSGQPGTDGHRLYIAHLQPGSVTVEAGDEVTEGDVIAACGNSGNTSEPHVHIHYVDMHGGTDDLIATGLPLYFRNIDGPEMPSGGISEQDGQIVVTGDTITFVPD